MHKNSVGIVINGNREISSLEHGTAECLEWECNLKQIVLFF